MDEVGFLVFAIASICALSIGGTVLPLWLRGTGRWNAMAIDVLTFFTGGVFLGAGMLHMLPEAAEQAEEAGVTSPLLNPFTCFCVGYLIVYVIEQHTGHQHPALTKEGCARAASAPFSLAIACRLAALADRSCLAPAASPLPASACERHRLCMRRMALSLTLPLPLTLTLTLTLPLTLALP